MKPTYKTLVYTVTPLLTAIAAFAQTDNSVARAAVESAPNPPTAAATDPGSGSRSISWRASEIIGANVKNKQDETIGEVKDLIIDWKSREVVAVVISTGGFLGVADTLSSVSLTSLKYDSDAKVFRTSLSKEELEKHPNFKSNSWPDFSDGTIATKLRAARNAIGGDVTAPDNTARNEKDATEHTETPMDQGNSEGDLNLTKDIRTAVIGSDLSFNAKNIKVITAKGHVTLRGVVDSEDEHQNILKIAQSHTEASNITDDLNVKLK
jgi:sporulation protein YlmC with PRC-barrel domain